MTARAQVSTVASGAALDDRLRLAILQEGYSRVPVLEDKMVVGILFAKDLLEHTKQTAGEVCERTILRARLDETLDSVLARMLRKRQHMAIVYNEQKEFVGVITLEDILEEVIQYEILDEDDDDPGPEEQLGTASTQVSSAQAR